MTTETVEQIVDMGKSLQTIFEARLGYDRATFHYAKVRENGDVEYVMTYRDEFQSDLPYDQKYYDDSLEPITPDQLAKWPTRSKRELSVMARDLDRLGRLSENLTHDLAKQFVQDLMPVLTELRSQIEDQS